jgi:serine/threonine kinase 16
MTYRKPENVLLLRDARAVLTDFGSASIARVAPKSRKEALALQEWCEETCSVSPTDCSLALSLPPSRPFSHWVLDSGQILYRAPELFDIQPDTEIDEQTDIWSLGCLLYYCLYRASPFEEAYATGSVKLAVLSSNNIVYPAQPRCTASCCSV